jgi:hypothetical protein
MEKVCVLQHYVSQNRIKTTHIFLTHAKLICGGNIFNPSNGSTYYETLHVNMTFVLQCAHFFFRNISTPKISQIGNGLSFDSSLSSNSW